jgi:hypothetical protein
MHDPLLVDVLTDMYFKTNDLKNGGEPDTVLTVPGLALAIGFSSTRDITNTLRSYEEGVSSYPKESIKFLIRALTRLEDYYLQNGIKEKFPAQLVKFCLGAYHDVKDTNSQSNAGVPANTNIMVVFNDQNQPNRLPSHQAKIDNNNQPVIEFNAL